MGSSPSKLLSNSSSLTNLFKGSIIRSHNNDSSIIRAYPKRSSINNKYMPSASSAPSQSISSPSIEKQKTLNLGKSNKNGSNTATLFGENTVASQCKDYNVDNVMDISLHKRLQNLGPVQRQDKSVNNYTLPSLFRKEDIVNDGINHLNPSSCYLQVPKSSTGSPVPSQVVLNPGLSKPKTDASSSSQSASVYNSDPGSIIGSLTSSNTTDRPAISLLKARNIFAQEAEAEFANVGKSGYNGRRYLDLDTVRQILLMRDTKGGPGNEEIEESLGLRHGIVKLLGKKGVVGVID